LVVHRLVCVFLDVDAGEADSPDPPLTALIFYLNIHMPAVADRRVVLGNLVTLGQIRVEILLPCEDRMRRDLTVRSQANADGVIEHGIAQYGQRAGTPRADRTDGDAPSGAEWGALP